MPVSPFLSSFEAGYPDAFAFEALTVGAAAVGLTAATYAPSTGSPAILAVVKIETAQVRYRTDGTDPTATVGTILDPGDVLPIWGSRDIASIRFIRTTGLSATANTEYSR